MVKISPLPLLKLKILQSLHTLTFTWIAQSLKHIYHYKFVIIHEIKYLLLVGVLKIHIHVPKTRYFYL
jgi:hypothetical protein